MRILGVGLSKTGTTSLHRALEILGFKSLHFDQKRLNDVLEGKCAAPDFRRYDDLDAVVDLPAAFFYREFLEAYPDAKAILTLREVEAWWKSIERHFNVQIPISNQLNNNRTSSDALFRARVRNMAYGSVVAEEYLYKKRYLEHNERVLADIPPERLLVMDITAGDDWKKLCSFLNAPIPACPFPALNRAPR